MGWRVDIALTKVEALADHHHLGEEGRVGLVDVSAGIGAAVDEGIVANGDLKRVRTRMRMRTKKMRVMTRMRTRRGEGEEEEELNQGRGHEGEPSVVDQGHQGIVNAVDLGVVNGSQALHFVQGRLHRLLVIGLVTRPVQIALTTTRNLRTGERSNGGTNELKGRMRRNEHIRRRRQRLESSEENSHGIEGELEEDALGDVLATASLSANIRRLDRHVLLVHGHFGDDDAAVGLGNVDEVLGELSELGELLERVGLVDQGLELAVPIRGLQKTKA